MSLRKNFVKDTDRTVYTLLDIENADEFEVRLTDYNGAPIERKSLSAKAELALAEWVEDCREEYRAYERDQRDINADYERWRDERDMRKSEGA